MIKQIRKMRERVLAAADRFRVEHGWKINPDSWHARLWRRAYIEDRASWLGAPWALETAWHNELFAKFPVMAAARELWRRRSQTFDCGWGFPMSNEDIGRFMVWMHAAEKQAKRVEQSWLVERRADWHAERSRELGERFAAGRVSLCPYFHMVWIAAVFYVCLIPFIRMVGRALRACGRGMIRLFRMLFTEHRTVMARVATVVVLCGLAFEVGVYRETIRHNITNMADWIRDVPRDYAAWRRESAERDAQVALAVAAQTAAEREMLWWRAVEDARIKAEQAARARDREQAEAEMAAWRSTHPDVAAVMDARELAWEAAFESERIENEEQRTIRMFRAQAEEDDWLLTICLPVAACVAAGTLAFVLVILLWGRITWLAAFVLALGFMAIERTRVGRGLLAGVDFVLLAFAHVFTETGMAIVRLICGFGRFLLGIGEGLLLLLAFMVATVRGACPMLIPVRKDDEREAV